MKKIKTVLEHVAAWTAAAGALATIISDRRIHGEHDEHLPCECRGSCLSCLKK
jgi:hypothetical protein